MDIFTIVKGTDLDKIETSEVYLDEKEAEEYASSINNNGTDVGLIKNSVSMNEKWCGHDSWNQIDHEFFDGMVFNCKECSNWLIIEPENEINITLINLSNEECLECEGESLYPITKNIFQCLDCRGYIKGEVFIDQESMNQLASISEDIAIEEPPPSESSDSDGES